MTDEISNATWRMLARDVVNKPLPRGADAVSDAGAGYFGKLVPRRKMILQQAERICALEPRYAKMTMTELMKRSAEIAAALEKTEAAWLTASEALEPLEAAL